MLSISIGPLALPAAPLLLMVAVWAAAALARRQAGSTLGPQAEGAVWTALVAGLLAARVGHVLANAQAYAATPSAIVDLRDGGWMLPAGLGVGGLVLAWRAWAAPPMRRALAQAMLAGVVLWAAGTAALVATGGGASTSTLPEVAFIDLKTGAPRHLREATAGRPTVVNLWASWCGPCRSEMPMLAAAQQRHRDVRFVFVNQGESADAVQRYLQDEGLALDEVWLDTGAALGPAVGSRGLPTTLFFNARGQRTDAHLGVLNAAALQAQLKVMRAP